MLSASDIEISLENFIYLLIFQHSIQHNPGMHLFLYQAARHSTTGGYYSSRRRYSQSSIRSDFDLALLKKGIKGRYEILGHGEHPFQAAMKNVGMEDEFYGHIVMIEDSKNAVWFKLNYDNIGKNQTKYLGGWRDLNSADLADHAVRYQELLKVERKINEYLGQVRTQFYYLNHLTDPRAPLAECMMDAKTAAHEYDRQLKIARDKLEAQLRENHEQVKALQDEVRNYLKEHKG